MHRQLKLRWVTRKSIKFGCVEMAKVEPELNLPRQAKSKMKGFYRPINQKSQRC